MKKFDMITFGLRRINVPLNEVALKATAEEFAKIAQMKIGETFNRKAGHYGFGTLRSYSRRIRGKT